MALLLLGLLLPEQRPMDQRGQRCEKLGIRCRCRLRWIDG
jgi:hypothetical protein